MGKNNESMEFSTQWLVGFIVITIFALYGVFTSESSEENLVRIIKIKEKNINNPEMDKMIEEFSSDDKISIYEFIIIERLNHSIENNMTLDKIELMNKIKGK